MPDPERPTARREDFRLLITAGPTHEPIDEVRYIANRSSGRLGVELASAAARRGIATTLLLGPTALDPPVDTSLTVVRFRTTADLARELDRLWPEHDVLIMAAAVADYRPVPAGGDAKIRRGDARLALELEPTPDLLHGLAAGARPDQVLIGFALEPAERLAESARGKLERKGVHAIVANPIETMESEAIRATVYVRGGDDIAAPEMSKRDFADWLLDRVPEIS
jgi:phosphopantothenoylcysteine decarboxylase/phosphopantothenate--cysteine ligase